MISLLTVTLDFIERHLEILIDSILTRTSLINEVIIATPDERKIGLDISWEERGIKFQKFYFESRLLISHAIGLHHCLDRASNEHVLFCDPDIFFYPNTDETYLELFNKHDLNFIGISHHNSTNQAQMFFPYIYNLLTKKSYLPPVEWKEDILKPRDCFIDNLQPHKVIGTPFYTHNYPLMPGKFLVQGPLPGYYDLFPNHDEHKAIFDVSCNLWLWTHEQNLKWLSFQTVDCHTYTTKYHRGSFKLKDKLPNKKLVYHCVGATNAREEEWLDFKRAYVESKEEE